ncbi:histidine kinase [Sphingomicrobium sp. XHP0239]|uniref:histidine kinase n=1 Tax=Sphingomicrobium maritimum TaxID=3133972 RepID=UPI0031CC8F19
MVDRAKILLLVEDISVLSALRFSLSIEGFEIAEWIGMIDNPSMVAALVIDERYGGDALAALDGLKKKGCCAPAIILATNPTAQLRARVAAANAELIEKPLLGDELSSAIRAILETRKAA